MAIRQIVEFPDVRLVTKTLPVEEIDDSIRALVVDMIDTMRSENGLGLAANQIGESVRIFVRDASRTGGEPTVFINPEVIESSGETLLGEGCLSFPGIYVDVKRPEFITVKAQNLNGEFFEHKESGYDARCVLHELDHLDGITFLERLSPLKRKLALGKLKPRKKSAVK